MVAVRLNIIRDIDDFFELCHTRMSRCVPVNCTANGRIFDMVQFLCIICTELCMEQIQTILFKFSHFYTIAVTFL